MSASDALSLDQPQAMDNSIVSTKTGSVVFSSTPLSSLASSEPAKAAKPVNFKQTSVSRTRFFKPVLSRHPPTDQPYAGDTGINETNTSINASLQLEASRLSNKSAKADERIPLANVPPAHTKLIVHEQEEHQNVDDSPFLIKPSNLIMQREPSRRRPRPESMDGPANSIKRPRIPQSPYENLILDQDIQISHQSTHPWPHANTTRGDVSDPINLEEYNHVKGYLQTHPTKATGMIIPKAEPDEGQLFPYPSLPASRNEDIALTHPTDHTMTAGQELNYYISSHADKFQAERERWTNCTLAEWTTGGDELMNSFLKILDNIQESLEIKLNSFANMKTDLKEYQTKVIDKREELLTEAKKRLKSNAGSLSRFT